MVGKVEMLDFLLKHFSNKKQIRHTFVDVIETVNADLLFSTTRQTRYFQVIQMSKTRMATRICELEKARMPSP
jgi:hypothetical protein